MEKISMNNLEKLKRFNSHSKLRKIESAEYQIVI